MNVVLPPALAERHLSMAGAETDDVLREDRLRDHRLEMEAGG